MKKLFSLILVVCMACMMIPAMAEDSVAGEWYASLAGVTMVMNLSEDGTAEMTMPGSENAASGTWVLDGEKITVTIEDSPAEGTYADGKITLGDEDMTMVFTREMPKANEIAEVNTAAAAEDFDGTWDIAYIGYNGTLVDASLAGQALPGLVVENSTMKFTGESSLAQVFGTNALPLTFADGALSLSVSLGETSYGLKLEMLEDGMLSLTAVMGDTSATMYFVKAAAEEPAA